VLCDFLLLCLGFERLVLQSSSFDVVPSRVFLRWVVSTLKKVGTVPFANPAPTYFALLILTSGHLHISCLFVAKGKSILNYLFHAA